MGNVQKHNRSLVEFVNLRHNADLPFNIGAHNVLQTCPVPVVPIDVAHPNRRPVVFHADEQVASPGKIRQRDDVLDEIETIGLLPVFQIKRRLEFKFGLLALPHQLNKLFSVRPSVDDDHGFSP